MSRNLFFLAMIALTLLGLGVKKPVVGQGAGAGAVSGDSPNIEIQPGGKKRSVTLSLINHDPDAVRSVTSQGSLVIEAEVTDTGNASRVRRLVAQVAVYERPDARSPTPGRFIGIYRSDRVMESPADGDCTERLGFDIRVAPGTYAFYLILCDPDRATPEDFLERSTEKFGEEVARALPGMILRASLFSATVNPGL